MTIRVDGVKKDDWDTLLDITDSMLKSEHVYYRLQGGKNWFRLAGSKDDSQAP